MLTPVQGHGWPEPVLVQATQGTRQDPYWIKHISIAETSHTHIYFLKLGQCRHINSSHVHIFEMWKETGESVENLCRHGENMQNPQTQKSHPRINFVFSETL